MKSERLQNSLSAGLPFDGLTSNMLRTVAALLMLADHIWATHRNLTPWMTYLGRMAFPIFAFQIAEGFVHTSNFKKYALRLLCFALLSEIPFNLCFGNLPYYPIHQNVLFTLLLGLLAIYVIDRAKKAGTRSSRLWALLWLSLMLIGADFGFVDYGSMGVLTVIVFYIFRDVPYAWLCRLAGLVLINFVFLRGNVLSVELLGISLRVPVQGFAVFSLIPIQLYRGKKGRSSKGMQYGFYAFYPAHLLILYLIRQLPRN